MPIEKYRGVTRDQFIGNPSVGVMVAMKSSTLTPAAAILKREPLVEGIKAAYGDAEGFAFDGDRLVGQYRHHKEHTRLSYFYVDPAYVSRGIGTALVYETLMRTDGARPDGRPGEFWSADCKAIISKVFDLIQSKL